MKILTWLGGLLGKGSSGGTPPTSNPASLPSLPVGSVAAVADALTEAGRIAEQQMALHNTPGIQQAKMTAQDLAVKQKINNDIATKNVDATRIDLAG